MAFCDILRDKLSERNIKAADLARAAGLSESIISEYLSGKKEPRGKQSVAISNALNVSLDELWETGFSANTKTAPAGQVLELSEDERKLVTNFRRSSPPDQEALVRFAAYAAASNHQSRSAKSVSEVEEDTSDWLEKQFDSQSDNQEAAR